MIKENGKMSARLALDVGRYTQLLTENMPAVITSEEQYNQLLAKLEPLFDRSMKDELSPEEDAMLELLSILIHKYEKENLVNIKADPLGMLKFFMEQQDKKPKDLWPVIGHKSVVSEILAGNRQINISHAKKLAKFFHTSPELFLDLGEEDSVN